MAFSEGLNEPDASRVVGALSVDRKLDDVFDRYRSEIQGTLFYLYNASENAATEAYDELRRQCSRKYANSEIGDLRVWVFRVLYNIAYDAVGGVKPKRRRNHSGASGTQPMKSDESAAPDGGDETVEESLNVFLRDTLLALSFNCRAVFLLRQNGALSYEQIARTTGASLDDVKLLMKESVMALVSASERYDEFLRQRKLEIVAEPDSDEALK